MYLALSAVAFILSLSGNLLVNFKKRVGFMIWLLSNIFWIIVNLISIQVNWFQISMFLAYTMLNVHGFINWRGKNK